MSELVSHPKAWLPRALALLESSLTPPRHELNEIDWKYQLSPDKSRLAEHLCAFANHPGGGYFVFGIEAAGVPVGISSIAIEEVIRQLSNIGRDALEPVDNGRQRR